MDSKNHYVKMFKHHYNAERLTKNEEDILINKVKQGSKKAVTSLVNANLGFILKLARKGRTFSRRFTIDDYFQAGAMGFIYALKKYDRSKGGNLRTYTSYHIKREIFFLAKNSHLIRIPMYVWDLKENKNTHIYDKLGITTQSYDIIRDGEASVEYQLESVIDSKLMRGMIDSLTKYEKRLADVIKYRYLLPKRKTHREIADLIGCTRSNIYSLEHKGLDFMKAYLARRGKYSLGDII